MKRLGMTKGFIAILLGVLLITVCPQSCLADDWDKIDKGLGIGLLTLNIVDILQTNYIYDHEEYNETNVNISKGVEVLGDTFVLAYFAVASIVEYWIADRLDSKGRKVFLGIASLLQLGYVSNNITVGIGFSF